MIENSKTKNVNEFSTQISPGISFGISIVLQQDFIKESVCPVFSEILGEITSQQVVNFFENSKNEARNEFSTHKLVQVQRFTFLAAKHKKRIHFENLNLFPCEHIILRLSGVWCRLKTSIKSGTCQFTTSPAHPRGPPRIYTTGDAFSITSRFLSYAKYHSIWLLESNVFSPEVVANMSF